MAKNIGMTPNHLICDIFYDILGREKPFFFGNSGMDGHLIEDISQFFADAVYIIIVNSIEHFIDFFDEISPQCPMRLGPVPRTAVFAAKPGRNFRKGHQIKRQLFLGHSFFLPLLIDEAAHGFSHIRSAGNGVNDGMKAALFQQEVDDGCIRFSKAFPVLPVGIEGTVIFP